MLDEHCVPPFPEFLACNHSEVRVYGPKLPHGVVGGMLLKELGFTHEIIATVTTHSPRMPFRNKSAAAHILHHADMFSADHAYMAVGKTPGYVKNHG